MLILQKLIYFQFSFKRMRRLLYNLVKPKSKDEDKKRHEFILNVILLGSIVITLIAEILSILNRPGPYYLDIPPAIIFIIPLSFLILYFLSRHGFLAVPSYALIIIYFAVIVYGISGGEIDSHTALLCFVLVIIISSILIHIRFAFMTTLCSSLVLLIINWLHKNKILLPNLEWRMSHTSGISEVIIFISFFSVTLGIAWLSNNELENSLKNLRVAEVALKKERTLLEEKVQKRTNQLREAQMEKISDLYRFAEFGRLSSGLFHDLLNHLTAVTFSVKEMEPKDKAPETAINLERANNAAKRMENFILAVRKQIENQEIKKLFSLNEEIAEIIQIFSYKACKSMLEITFAPAQEIKTYGDSIKFSQLLSNLLSNAIDSYENVEQKKREVRVEISEKNNFINLVVKYWGKGISKEDLNTIFDPLYKSNGPDRTGLCIVKNIVENNFNGKITVKSHISQGTEFAITFPSKKEPKVKKEAKERNYQRKEKC